jgi:hypothetical protein
MQPRGKEVQPKSWRSSWNSQPLPWPSGGVPG